MRVLILAALMLVRTGAGAQSVTQRVGTCSFTTIHSIGTRLESLGHVPDPVGGMEVTYANGGYSASYDGSDAVARSRVGDRVMQCLVAIPRSCPQGTSGVGSTPSPTSACRRVGR